MDGAQSLSHYPAVPPPVRVRLAQLEPHDCAYLPGRVSRCRGIYSGESLEGEVFEAFLNTGFRRSGHVLYQPVCSGCRACTPLRIDVREFRPSKSQRRVLQRNSDLTVRLDHPELTSEKHELYVSYQAAQHDKGPSGPEAESIEDLHEFLYQSPVTTAEVTYRTPDGALVGAGIVDITENVLSSVYFYWRPEEHRRSLGVYSLLREIQLTQELGRNWYHLGYWVAGSPTMHYKATMADHEVLCSDGVWRRQSRVGPIEAQH